MFAFYVAWHWIKFFVAPSFARFFELMRDRPFTLPEEQYLSHTSWPETFSWHERVFFLVFAFRNGGKKFSYTSPLKLSFVFDTSVSLSLPSIDLSSLVKSFKGCCFASDVVPIALTVVAAWSGLTQYFASDEKEKKPRWGLWEARGLFLQSLALSNYPGLYLSDAVYEAFRSPLRRVFPSLKQMDPYMQFSDLGDTLENNSELSASISANGKELVDAYPQFLELYSMARRLTSQQLHHPLFGKRTSDAS